MNEVESTEAIEHTAVAIMKDTRHLMPALNKRQTQATILGVLVVCFSCSSLCADEWMSGIETFDDTLEATLTCSSTKPFEQSKDIFVRYDPATTRFYGRIISKVTRQKSKPKMWDDEHSQNSQQSSSSIRSFGSPIKQIEIKPRSHADLPSEGTILKTLKIPYVKYAYLPLHKIELAGLKYRLELIQESFIRDNVKRFEYLIKIDDEVGVEVTENGIKLKLPVKTGDEVSIKATYDIEFSDGIKILNGKLEENGSFTAEVRNSHHMKKGPIWVATEVAFSRHSDGKKVDDTKINITDISFGKVFDDDDYVIKPNVGDDIYDGIAGRHYIYSQATTDMAKGGESSK